MSEITSESYAHHLHVGVPFHELVDSDINLMSHDETLNYVKHVRASRVSASDKKKMKAVTTKAIATKAKNGITASDSLKDLF